MLVHTCIFLFMVVNGDQTSCCVWNNESASFVRRIYSVFMSKTVSFMSKPCQFFFGNKRKIFSNAQCRLHSTNFSVEVFCCCLDDERTSLMGT